MKKQLLIIGFILCVSLSWNGYTSIRGIEVETHRDYKICSREWIREDANFRYVLCGDNLKSSNLILISPWQWNVGDYISLRDDSAFRFVKK